MNAHMLTLAVLAAFVASAQSDETLNLTKDGHVTAEVVIAEDAPRPVAFAKKELETYLGILATNGVDQVKARGEGEQRKVRVFISVDGKNPELKEDGFVIEADALGVRIVGQNPRGALYGAYEILKRYGGVRWLAPGADCEYFTLKGDVVVPYGRSVQNPHMKIRTMNSYGSGPASWVWAARNNRVMEANNDWFCDKDGKRTKNCDLLEDCCMAGQGPGGHVICELMYGEFKHEKKARLERLDKVFKEHPNWFPLVRGKRITWYANPCLQDPALFDHMAKNYLVELRKPHAFDLPVIIGNNDTTVWCECEKCKAMDDESFGPTGKLANRYWYMVNELAKRIWKEIPDARLAGWAYQNFWYPPTTVKPDPRLGVLISYNNQCWRHSVTEPGCIVNAEMARIYRAWRKMDVAYLWNRAEISCEDAPGTYAPAERTLYNNYREYPSIGCDGDHYCCYPPDWKFMDWAKNTPPYYGHNYRFWAMWQTQWLSSQFMWDIDRNFEALYEECNRLYYGAAWEGGMRSFRELLKESFYHGQGCVGWGQHNPLGKCLAWPADAQERLSALLEKAIASAKAAGDERAHQHVLRDREIFKLTWIDPYREYVASRRELTAHGRTGEIVVDGVLSEKDWQTAETLGDFRRPYWEETSIRTQKVEIATRAKVVWDKDTLYFAVEAFDPEMDNIRAGKPAEVDRNAGWSALGDNIQLFYQSLLMGEKAYLLCFNSEGAILDGVKKSATVFDGSFNTEAKYAVKKETDRWVLELAIPASEIGFRPAEGDMWRINVCRARAARPRKTGRHEDGDERLRLTSANGRFYAPSSFVELKFEK